MRCAREVDCQLPLGGPLGALWFVGKMRRLLDERQIAAGALEALLQENPMGWQLYGE
jgi:hypothetical protein